MALWNDQQYLKFGDERTRAARELLQRVQLSTAARVVDLGCGPGNSTALLRERFPTAKLCGVDNSPEMLARARRDFPDIDWLDADAATFRAREPVDLLFANAVLHWLPNHAELFRTLLEQLEPGGVLAVQMPRNFAEASHRLMRETSADAAASGTQSLARLNHVRDLTPVESPEFYYDLLAPHARSVDIWETVYEHVMVDAAAIVEWVKGTGLRPYLDALSAEERPRYLERYTAGIERAYPMRSDGRRLLRFPRLFLVAVR
ncbi:MAG TPA: trans-aconitate 2-methyltransferase [Polyangiaceae bacterium]|jgi:trans-aconitate 2-methyltransferase